MPEVNSHTFIFEISPILLALGLMLGMSLLLSLGIFVRKKTQRNYTDMGGIEGACYGLLGLITAFTFGMATTRYEQRKNFVLEEVNAISTAISLLHKLDDRPTLQAEFYQDFRTLIQLRMEKSKHTIAEKVYNELRWQSMQKLRSIGDRVAQVSATPALGRFSAQMIQSLTRISDAFNSRFNAMHSTVPDAIIFLLFLLSLLGSFMAGYSLDPNKHINWIPIWSYVVFTGIVLYMVLDIDHPVFGFVKLDFQYDLQRQLLEMLPTSQP